MSSMIKNIEIGSPAFKAGIHPGDTLLTINGHEIRDVLDYKYYSYDAKLQIEVSNGIRIRKVRIRKGEGQDLGLEFETYLMDHTHSCANHCVFCFVDQLPKGMRSTLYFKDDDARLSFLLGNYITLTNLSEHEVQRLIRLKVSPINVSVHTTDPELRNKMLGSPRGEVGLEIMRRFAEAGIVMNCQIVCCPGINDDVQLQKSMEDLRELYPAVQSVSVVPVGLTKYREGLYPLRPFNQELAEKTVNQVEKYGQKCLQECSTRIFFCADELYLKAGFPIPPDEYYEDYPQLENGVGMLRLMEMEFIEALHLADKPDGLPFSIATGVSAAPFMQRLIIKAQDRFPEVKGKVYAIENLFFGTTIDVAGLITGGDLIAQLQGKELGERLLIPQTMLRHGEGIFLDNVTLEDVEKHLNVPVCPVEQDGFKLLEGMFGKL